MKNGKPFGRRGADAGGRPHGQGRHRGDRAREEQVAVGTPRAVVDAAYTKKLFVPYDSVIPPSAKSFVKIQRAVVTSIVEGKNKLVAGDDVRDKFRTKLSTYLKRLGVKVVLGERLTERLASNSFEKRTDKGTEIESDVQLLCGGFSPTTELIQKLDASLVTREGFIKVNNKLQLDSAQYANIYALGDASNSPAPKRMFYAGLQGKHLGAELALVARKAQSNVSKPFPKVEVVGTVLPLGPNGGVSQLPVMGGVVEILFSAHSAIAMLSVEQIYAEQLRAAQPRPVSCAGQRPSAPALATTLCV
ncbi:hypothetical protein PF005_g10391 [Phytophthora fragariae]|uniref:FAD/NAD(P)-binding domain-containing protein n=1 Tax=Phytophthora fragariae TaxID=53985 RepID=A0A6A3EY20_9STRA|nr:hypothetical protein PF003_g14541 [Phytophthora fragariae]KAE8938325.1 hypothetical protein PF009_g11788 [Phytophthora fragariae]KAE9114659.1 hypothetical protein PF007_g10294 [Phytophthora fragariae]KAE9212932.1 hypothetical protein PF005_g10391 [Phytophthora fragariae]KAE9233914.1 hypothetical protein PF002_g11924 [Phytophthora fragariae]